MAEFSAPHAAQPGQRAVPPQSRPIEPGVRAVMESRFDQDFSQVRVHTDPEAAREHGAIAYTTGRHIGFAPDQYRPDTPRGRALLAHELAHVVQQTGQQYAPDAPVSSPGEPAEQAADLAAGAFGRRATPEDSVALAVRDQLRATRSRSARVHRVATWAGDFDTDKYDIVKDATGDSTGVDIELRFKPGKNVNATLIGMTQLVNTKYKGAPLAGNATVAARSIPAGQPDAGAHIDRLAAYGNPLYATKQPAAKDKLASTPTDPFWGQHGYRYQTGNPPTTKERDALLKDTPELRGHGPNASQIFESTAVAVSGVQKGTYYGSVQWGWRSDATNNFTKLPLTVVSNDVPSASFNTAAGLWAANPTSTGQATIPLPTAQGKFTNIVDVELRSTPSDTPSSVLGKLAKNTRLEATDSQTVPTKSGKGPWTKVTVVGGGGPLVGRVGWVLSATLADAVTP